MAKAARTITIFLASVLIGGMTLWASLAIYYSDLPYAKVAALLFALAVLVSFLFLPKRRRTFFCFLSLFLAIVIWWMSIPASNNRGWQKDVAVLPHATVAGSLVTVHNIRNFSYRTDTDFDVHYYDKTFDLTVLNSVDLIAVYWMGDAIAHIMISFGFQGKNYLVFSIETRKEETEGYSAIKGFFKQYELIYIAGDERDLLRVRTDYRNPREDVYLYRTRVDQKRAAMLFMEYIRQINALNEKAVWYNTLTTNCTTNIVMHIKTFSDHIRYNWKIFLSGYTPLYAYELGALDTRISFAELRRRSRINLKARLIGDDPGFSRKIREGLPLPDRGD